MKTRWKTSVGLLILMTLMATLAYMLRLDESASKGKSGRSLGICDVKDLIGAPKDRVFFLYWANRSSDVVAAKAFYDACKHPSDAFYQLGDQMVDERGCPRSEAFGADEYLVFFGGPSVQPAVKYYEESGQAPVALSFVNSSHIAWTYEQGNAVSKEVVSLLEFDAHHDMFTLEFFVDSYNRSVFICYGWDWQGTSAGATYMVDKMIPIIDQYQKPFCIFRWVDSNNDYIPQADEILEEKQRYVNIQAMLHWTADPEIVNWFANACHSRGLKITWYVMPEHNSMLAPLLKNYTGSGDDVQLSLGSEFFNGLDPEERLLVVNEQLANFKKQFGFYPSLVEAYYIDAFTLNYIASRYSFVEGAVGYVNHEEFCDGFRAAGAYYMPYYPSKLNALVAGKGNDRIPIVMLPFVQRDISNNILHHDVRYNLSPQDGVLVVSNWREYFEKLLDAYVNGWDEFGLASYLVDLTFEPLPKEVIEKDLDSICHEIELNNCTNIMDKDFVEWFKGRFTDSPCYTWTYNDPDNGGFLSVWHFTDEGREGGVVGQFEQTMEFANKTPEGCYNKRVDLYDNSLETIFGVEFAGFREELIQSPSNQTTYRKSDGASAYDFWNFPIINIAASTAGTYNIDWSYSNYLDGKQGGLSGAIINTVQLVFNGQTKDVQLNDTRDPAVSLRDPNRGGSIAYGNPEALFDGVWHVFESRIYITVISPSGAMATCQGYLREEYKSTAK